MTPWSHQGRLHYLEHLKENLIHVVKDVAMLDKVITKLDIKNLTRKFLPSFGQETADVREKGEENVQSQESMLSQTNDIRTQLMNDGRRDEMDFYSNRMCQS